MKIGELSKATGTNIETIRYYERIGLLSAPARTDANYRSYGPDHRSRLSFVRHSRELGFTIEEIRSLLDLSDHPDRLLEKAFAFFDGSTSNLGTGENPAFSSAMFPFPAAIVPAANTHSIKSLFIISFLSSLSF